MLKISTIKIFLVSLIVSGCQMVSEDAVSIGGDVIKITKKNNGDKKTITAPAPKNLLKRATAEMILARPEVPVLCYHQIRNWRTTDSKQAKDYIVPVDGFKAQMKMLADSGYHTILPDELRNYLVYGTSLPSKPFMITFDDTDLDQYTIAAPEMARYGFKGVFFIMTVSIGRPNYMNSSQIKELSGAGHVIGSHTWDHHNVKKYEGEDWVTQIEKPTKRLKEITGKDVKYFAYPFGLWNPEAIPELAKRGFAGAFVLAEERDEQQPLFTIRRIIASGYWTSQSLHNSMINSFSVTR